MSTTLRLRPSGPFAWRGLLATLETLLVALSIVGCNGHESPSANAVAVAATTPSVPRVMAIARGTVEIPGGLLEVTTSQEGVVESVAVQECAHVKRGQILLKLSSELLRQELATTKAELKLAQARQAAQQARLPSARLTAARMAQAVLAEAIDAQRSDDSQQTLRDLESGVLIAAAETAVAEQKVAQVQVQVQRLAVLAPQDATVLRLLTQPGVRVSAAGSKPLLTLLPAKMLRVRAEVNEAYVSRVVVGMRASIYLDSDVPGATAVALPGAHVVRLSPVYGASRLEDENQARGNVRVVECFLDFDQTPSLRIGQTVRVEFYE